MVLTDLLVVVPQDLVQVVVVVVVSLDKHRVV